MAVRWQYDIGHYFRERRAPRRLFKLVGYSGPYACLAMVDVNGKIIAQAQLQHVNGLETVLDPVTEEQFEIQRVLFGTTEEKANKTDKIEEPEYNDWTGEWRINGE